ncbi:hypothetical protein FEM48_Zijuj04G0062500 [Ziziphus jujuba var. spinosa]|uniref:Uncharacterized protein n=1 Tax=Ziziphus jujuba var. spinosa TaxID=714518 RepID=A0A978VI97_ZIZJJ|nr:hypothetical protein FEM48_Zijuj04G0062500 [Ziziphus jujuba var. spinosa]
MARPINGVARSAVATSSSSMMTTITLENPEMSSSSSSSSQAQAQAQSSVLILKMKKKVSWKEARWITSLCRRRAPRNAELQRLGVTEK